MEEEANFDGERRRLTRWACNVTGIYMLVLFALLLAVLFGEIGIDSFRTMYPNEVGDLLAGIAGPFALIWLVYGYLLQGISMRQNANEIAQNAKVLSMQVVEMEAQKKRRKSAIAPSFHFRYVGDSSSSDARREINVEIKNANGNARKVKIHFEDEGFCAKPLILQELASGGHHMVTFSFYPRASGCIPFFVTYIDSDDENGECRFQMEIQRVNGAEISHFDFKPIYD